MGGGDGKEETGNVGPHRHSSVSFEIIELIIKATVQILIVTV